MRDTVSQAQQQKVGYGKQDDDDDDADSFPPESCRGDQPPDILNVFSLVNLPIRHYFPFLSITILFAFSLSI